MNDKHTRSYLSIAEAGTYLRLKKRTGPTFDPEHLHEAARATNIILEKLDALTIRPMVPLSVKQRRILAGPLVVNG
jgi:hypothetical protein